jgi:hypothetical protein
MRHLYRSGKTTNHLSDCAAAGAALHSRGSFAYKIKSPGGDSEPLDECAVAYQLQLPA